MKKCNVCGGICLPKGNGTYQCDCCGAVLTEDDFAATSSKSKGGRAESAGGDVGADIFEKNVNAVLEISTRLGSGSGYLVSGGYGITNSHVVCLQDGSSCGTCSVKVAGETVSARVVAMGTEDNSMHATVHDLALIKLDRTPVRSTAVRFGDSDKVRTGERVFVIGNSLGYGTCITSGIVSDNNRNGRLMYDSATNPGNSGGPVFDADGKVIGTHVAGTSPNGVKAQGMNYAIPARAVLDFLRRNGLSL